MNEHSSDEKVKAWLVRTRPVDADRRLGLKRPFDVSESDSSDEAGQCIGHIETGRDLGSVVAAQSLPKRRFIEEQDSTAARDALYVRAYRIIQHRHAIKEMAQGNMAPMKYLMERSLKREYELLLSRYMAEKSLVDDQSSELLKRLHQLSNAIVRKREQIARAYDNPDAAAVSSMNETPSVQMLDADELPAVPQPALIGSKTPGDESDALVVNALRRHANGSSHAISSSDRSLTPAPFDMEYEEPPLDGSLRRRYQVVVTRVAHRKLGVKRDADIVQQRFASKRAIDQHRRRQHPGPSSSSPIRLQSNADARSPWNEAIIRILIDEVNKEAAHKLLPPISVCLTQDMVTAKVQKLLKFADIAESERVGQDMGAPGPSVAAHVRQSNRYGHNIYVAMN